MSFSLSITTTMKTITRNLILVSFAGSLLAIKANASVIIYDDFENSGGTSYSLNSTLADVNYGTTWTSSANLSGGTINVAVNPTGYLTPTQTDEIAFIDGLTLNPNTIYSLSMDVNVVSGGANWFGFGFRTGSFSNLVSGTVGSMLQRGNGDLRSFNTNSGSPQTTAQPSGPSNLEIQLATGATLGSSNLSWYFNGTQVGTNQAVNASSIDGVFLHTFQDAGGSIDNYTLETIPEPSSAALLGLGGLLLFRRKRS